MKTDNVFTITFKLSDNSTEESLQDLAIDLSNVRLPKVIKTLYLLINVKIKNVHFVQNLCKYL